MSASDSGSGSSSRASAGRGRATSLPNPTLGVWTAASRNPAPVLLPPPLPESKCEVMLLRTTRMAAAGMNDARGREPRDDVDDESESVVVAV